MNANGNGNGPPRTRITPLETRQALDHEAIKEQGKTIGIMSNQLGRIEALLHSMVGDSAERHERHETLLCALAEDVKRLYRAVKGNG
jgi:hypothetical protein